VIELADYLDTVEAQLAELTDRGAHRRLRARAPIPTVGGRMTIPGTGGRGPRFRTDVLALVAALAVTAAVVAVVLSAGLGSHHPTGAAARGHRNHVQPSLNHRHKGRSGNETDTTTTSTTTPNTTTPTGPIAPAGPVPPGFAPQSFTAISEFTWWLLGTAPCSSPPCTSIVRTNNGGRTFVGTPAPRTDKVSQLRFADAQNGFAYGPQLWVTHDAGATWHHIALTGTVTDLAIADGEVYAIVNDGYGAGQLYRSPAGTDAWAPDAAAGNALGGLWVHGPDVLLESAGGRLLVSHDGGGNFANYGTPPSVVCEFDEMAPSVIWEHCATGMMSGIWRSTDGGQTYAAAGGGSPPAPGGGLPNSAAFSAASATTAVVGYKQLYRTTNGGASYTRVAGPAGITFWQYLGFSDTTHGVALGYVGSNIPSHERLYYTTDAGASYHPVVIH
jgi:photosystem II stability/assembly factor-like uncharacterized protein